MTGDGDRTAGGPWRPRLVLGLALLALAGFVDAAGFLGFGLFPSFFSGDTTQLSIAYAQRNGARSGVLAGAVVIFVAGAFVGRLLRLRTGRRAPVLWTEAALLALAAAAARYGVDVGALACAAFAMGAQTSVLTHAGPAPIGTTYVTGTLARLGSGLADALAGGDRTEWLAFLLLWIALVAGAVAGALCYGRLGLESLLVAAAAAAVLALGVALVERGQARDKAGRTP